MFNIKTGQETIQSELSGPSTSGQYDKTKNQVVFKWENREDLFQDDPNASFNATLDTLRQSTIHICITQIGDPVDNPPKI